jgi:hypothetical protein
MLLTNKKTNSSLYMYIEVIHMEIFVRILLFAGLTLEGEEVALWRLTSLSPWSKAKFKSPCNFEESPYVATRVFSPLVIYENVDIVHVNEKK